MKLYYKYFLICALLMCSYATMWGDVLTHSVSFPTTARHTQVVTLDDGRQYVELKYDNTESTSDPGAPSLPVRYIKLSVPYNACNFSVSCTYRTRTSARASKKIIPCEQPITTNDEAIDSLYIVEDSTIYSNNALYPASLGEVVSEGYFMGSNHVITIAVYPSQYNPVSGQLYFYGSVTATVRYDIDEQCQNILSRYDSQLRDEEQQMLMSMVENGVQVPVFAAPPVTPPGNIQLLSSNSSSNIPCDSLDINIEEQRAVESYEYTIITTRELKPAFKRLVALKRQKGLDAGVVCIEDIMANPIVNMGDVMYDRQHNYVSTIADSAGVVREYLKYAFAYGTKYVLIGGQGLPFRYGYRNSTDSNGDTIEYNVPTDWYFSDLNTNWNLDNNHFYGERLIIRNFDYFPELYVGRIMCSESNEIINYTNKLIRYELNPGKGNPSYLKNVLVVNGAEGFDVTNEIQNAYHSSGFDDTLIEQASTTFPTGPYIIENINNKGILSIHGHGNPHSTTVNYHDGHRSYHRITALDINDDNYTVRPELNNGLDLLTNKYEPGIFYSWACTTTPYDTFMEPSNSYVYNGWNMGQSYTLGKDYGGVAYFGDTRNGYISFKNHEVNFVNSLSNIHQAGIVEAYTKTISRSMYFTMVHNLIGDPEFSIWTDIPDSNNNYSIVRHDNGISIEGNIDSNAIIGCCSNNTQFYYRASDLRLSPNNISPNSSIIIYKHNQIPYIAPIKIQNCEIKKNQYLIGVDIEIGNSVDNNRTIGNVVVKPGVEYDIEYNGSVLLGGGFDVEKGASLNVFAPDDKIF